MRIDRAVPFFAIVLLAAACGRGRTPAAAAAPEPARAFAAPVRLYYDNGGGVADSVREVVRDAPTFQRWWSQATSRQPSPPAAPAVDFAQDMVLVVAAGRLTPDDEIRVDSVGITREIDPAGRSQETLRVVVRMTLACERVDIDGYPLEIVRVRRFEGPVRFADNRVQAQNCRDGPRPEPSR
jgi:hypothetical protein